MRPAMRSGWKRLERLDAFADPHQHDRLAGDRAHRQCRPAAGVAVHPRQHDPGYAGARSPKAFATLDRVLTGHRIGDEQGLVR